MDLYGYTPDEDEEVYFESYVDEDLYKEAEKRIKGKKVNREKYEKMLLGGMFTLMKHLESEYTEYDVMLLGGGKSPQRTRGDIGSF